MPGLVTRRPGRGQAGAADAADACRAGWLKEPRTWNARRRGAVAEGMRAVLDDPAFAPNEFRRR